MRCPQMRLRHTDADAAYACRDPFRQHGEALRDRRRPPIGQHLHADRGHLHRNEMIALAHVEAPGIADVIEIAEIHRVLGAHVAAAGGSLLQRDAALMAFRNIEKSAAVWAEQPFVGREDHKIRIEARHIHRQHAGALRRVHQKCTASLPERRADFFDIDQPAIRPVHRGDRGQADRRGARPFDAFEKRRCPVSIGRLLDRLDAKPWDSARKCHSSTGDE